VNYFEAVEAFKALGLKDAGAQVWAQALTSDGRETTQAQIEDLALKKLPRAAKAIRERRNSTPTFLTTPEENFESSAGGILGDLE
jgi:hypothetical protein